MTEPRYICPYCYNWKVSPNGTGGDVSCCGEVGHSTRCRCNFWTNHKDGWACDRCDRKVGEEFPA